MVMVAKKTFVKLSLFRHAVSGFELCYPRNTLCIQQVMIFILLVSQKNVKFFQYIAFGCKKWAHLSIVPNPDKPEPKNIGCWFLDS